MVSQENRHNCKIAFPFVLLVLFYVVKAFITALDDCQVLFLAILTYFF